MHFWSFWAKYWHFLPIWSHARPKSVRTMCLGGFFVMWVTKLLIFPVEIRIFCPKTTKFGPKLAFLVNLGQAMQGYSVPCWWVSWWLWRAGCILQDAYLLFITWCKNMKTNSIYFRRLPNCNVNDDPRSEEQLKQEVFSLTAFEFPTGPSLWLRDALIYGLCSFF